MWCIGRLTEEYRRRMYGLLDLYARPYRKQEPVVCIDEKSKQLLKDTRSVLPIRPGAAAKHDYEYKRAGTCNLFVAVEPKGERRVVQVTGRRTKVDFVNFICRLLEEVYSGARKVHLVLDNLNTHFRSSFEQVLGLEAAAVLLRRVEFHHTPTHASWLNQIEIYFSIIQRKVLTPNDCTSLQELEDRIIEFGTRYSALGKPFAWCFTRQDLERRLRDPLLQSAAATLATAA